MSDFWIPAEIKPNGPERRVLCWVVWPEQVWRDRPEPIVGWWKHGPACFSIQNIENANHLVTHWRDIPNPSQDT